MKWTSKLKKQKKTIVSIYIRVKYNAIQTIIVQLPAAVAEVEWYFAYNACKSIEGELNTLEKDYSVLFNN